MIARLFALCVLLLGFAIAAPGRSAEIPKAVPVVVGRPQVISTELAYNGFPSAAAVPDGGFLVGYSSQVTHFLPARVIVRRSLDGQVWSDPAEVPPLAGLLAGESYTGAILAAETTAQGGRIYLAQLRLTMAGQSVAEASSYVRTSDDGGRTWSAPLALPGQSVNPGWGSLYASNAAVAPDGSVWLAGYGFDGHARYLRSTDRGASWLPAGDLAVAGRVLQEPTLCPLADGRMYSALRSDGQGADGSQRLYASIFDGAWSTPKVITWDGSGMPSCAEVSAGVVAILYRGFVERADMTRRPLRGLMSAVDGGWGRGNIDITPEMGPDLRSLYGAWVRGEDGWLAVFATEGPRGQTYSAATVWAMPVQFRPVPQ